MLSKVCWNNAYQNNKNSSWDQIKCSVKTKPGTSEKEGCIPLDIKIKNTLIYNNVDNTLLHLNYYWI